MQNGQLPQLRNPLPASAKAGHWTWQGVIGLERFTVNNSVSWEPCRVQDSAYQLNLDPMAEFMKN